MKHPNHHAALTSQQQGKVMHKINVVGNLLAVDFSCGTRSLSDANKFSSGRAAQRVRFAVSTSMGASSSASSSFAYDA